MSCNAQMKGSTYVFCEGSENASALVRYDAFRAFRPVTYFQMLSLSQPVFAGFHWTTMT